MIDGLKNKFINNLLISVKKRAATSATGIHDWAVLGQFVGYGNVVP